VPPCSYSSPTRLLPYSMWRVCSCTFVGTGGEGRVSALRLIENHVNPLPDGPGGLGRRQALQPELTMFVYDGYVAEGPFAVQAPRRLMTVCPHRAPINRGNGLFFFALQSD